jgi:diadenosine tetraphosphate (Ap4A) HIT family hydrolase
LWPADGVRVIRPRRRIIASQVIVLPVRHVVSAGDLRPAEIVSIGARLGEIRRAFRGQCTGLSCFLNDGIEGRQETPHVHIHVFGRSRNEAGNPFEFLLQPWSDVSPVRE